MSDPTDDWYPDLGTAEDIDNARALAAWREQTGDVDGANRLRALLDARADQLGKETRDA